MLQQFLYKSERKIVNTYLKFVDTTIKPAVLYAVKAGVTPNTSRFLTL